MKKVKKSVAVLLIASVFMSCFAPLVLGDLTPQEKRDKYYDDVCSFAKEDADYSENTCLWQAAGLFLGPVGMILGYFILPPIPASRLMGRSSEYVEKYTSCYDDTVRWANLWASGTYCAFLTVIIVGGYLFLGFAKKM